MADFKSGRRPATIMHQIARGYSERQIEQIALWLETPVNAMRRKFLKEMAVATAALLSGCATTAGKRSNGHVVVVGGGFAGATVAKYLRLWSGGRVAVTLVERRKQFVSCPISNLVLVGIKSLADISVGYGGLQKLGVEVINDEVSQIDPQGRSIRLASGQRIAYDRCVLAPGLISCSMTCRACTARRRKPDACMPTRRGRRRWRCRLSSRPCRMVASMR